jgi:Flp pilus assembly pilin Flp
MSETAWVQYGALGIVAFVVWRSLLYLTTSLNGKFDKLTKAVETSENTHRVATKELTEAMNSLRDAVERVNRVP